MHNSKSHHSAPAASLNRTLRQSHAISDADKVTLTFVPPVGSTTGSVAIFAKAPNVPAFSWLTFTSPAASVGLLLCRRGSAWLGSGMPKRNCLARIGGLKLSIDDARIEEVR